MITKLSQNKKRFHDRLISRWVLPAKESGCVVKSDYIIESLKRLVKAMGLLRAVYKLKLSRYEERLSCHLRNLLVKMESDEVLFIKELKWELSSLLALYLDNPVEAAPATYRILPLWYISVILRIRCSETKLVSILFGILQWKKIFPAVPASFISDAFRKHRKTMSTKGKPLSQGFRDSIREKYMEIFTYGWDKDFGKFKYKVQPTGSATFECTRSVGGLREHFYRQTQHDHFCDDHLHEWDDVLRMMVTTEDSEVLSNPVFESEVDDYLYNLPVDLQFKCRAACVQDPLKARIVTCNKGVHIRLKPIQEIISRFLRDRIPALKYTREPCGSSLENPDKTNGWFFVSGDYSAATDNLARELSEIGLEVAMDLATSIPEDLKTEAKFSLTNNEIHYPKKENLDPVQQQKGQLMGSLLSFPFLNTGNFIAFWISLERYYKKGLPMEFVLNRFLLINGDDILFQANKTLYSIWWKVCMTMGLTPSIGKNLYHSRFFTINSILFRRNGSELERVGYLPMQFLVAPPQSIRVSKNVLTPLSLRSKLKTLLEIYLRPSRDLKLGDANQHQRVVVRFLEHNLNDYVSKDFRFYEFMRGEWMDVKEVSDFVEPAVLQGFMHGLDWTWDLAEKLDFNPVSYLQCKEDFSGYNREWLLQVHLDSAEYRIRKLEDKSWAQRSRPVSLNTHFDEILIEGLEADRIFQKPEVKMNLSSPLWQLWNYGRKGRKWVKENLSWVTPRMPV